MNETGFFSSLAASVIISVIAENLVFSRAFGVTPMISAAKNKRNLPGVCAGVSYFTAVSSIGMWAVSKILPIGGGKYYLVALYALIVGVIYFVTLLCAFIFVRNKFVRIKKYVHISAFNSAVMGTIFLSVSVCTTFSEYLIFGITSGLGFAAASYMLSGVYSELYSENVPRAFRGYPAIMIFSGIMAMAVYGILGHAPSYV